MPKSFSASLFQFSAPYKLMALLLGGAALALAGTQVIATLQPKLALGTRDKDEELVRRLERELPRDARIFVDGVAWDNHEARTATYLFLKDYLFPREVEISMDSNPVQSAEGFAGVACASLDQLRERGFDVLIRWNADDLVEEVFLVTHGPQPASR